MPVSERSDISGGTNSIRDRPDLLLSLDPETANFLPTGGQSEHMLVNLGKLRAVVKVRCSDNSLFRVNPVYMFIESGQCCNVIVTRLPGPPKNDKLVFHYLPCPDPKYVNPDVDGKKVFEETTTRKPESLKLTINCVNKEDVPKVGPSTPTK